MSVPVGESGADTVAASGWLTQAGLMLKLSKILQRDFYEIYHDSDFHPLDWCIFVSSLQWIDATDPLLAHVGWSADL